MAHADAAAPGLWGPGVVIGATGRLGRAVLRSLGTQPVTAVARRPPNHRSSGVTWLAIDCGDVAAMTQAVSGTRWVLHLTLSGQPEVDALLSATAGLAERPRLVVASTIAERPLSSWSGPDDLQAPMPTDEYGRARRMASDTLLAQWPSAAVALLPQLLVADDPSDRLALWAHQARQGVVQVPGTGEQRPALLDVDDAAGLLLDLCRRPQVWGRLTLGHPRPVRAIELARAVAQATGSPEASYATGATNRAVSAGSEPLGLDRQGQLWPSRQWMPLILQVMSASKSWISST